MNAREPNLVSNVILPVSNYCPNDNNTKNIHKQTTRTYIHTHPHTHNQSINDNDNQQQQQQPTSLQILLLLLLLVLLRFMQKKNPNGIIL
mmetsp:Transcript_30825/g.34616  ORF Transcript_30825/g.34616 Transcript_30825/m.34616 type:complete len:90 (-) Transcript_30825:801-1070(-)